MNFSDMKLINGLLNNLKDAGYLTPTPIQAGAIPAILDGKDLLGIAQTGTGKTAAFTLPIIQHLLKRNPNSKDPRALILVPTRELATQIQTNIETYAKNLNIKSIAIFGGVNQATQVKAMRGGIDILVATPGRLLDLIQQDEIRLKKIEMFVLDEADRMLDMGFIEDIERIIKELPIERQSMFFSATMPAKIVHLSKEILSSPIRIEIARSGTSADNIDQKIIFCKKQDKFQLLRKIIKEQKPELAIVFTKKKDSAEKVREYLRFHKIPSVIIHGDKDQSDRDRALELFKNKSMKIMIATDVAARGIDIPDVSHVINYELPMEAESYVHRIGRTARAGREGKAITFCDETESEIIERVQKLMKKAITTETYKGIPEPSGIWSVDGPMKRRITPPTPGKSQEKTAYLDHSKRQKVLKEGEKAKPHPGFRGKKKKRK